jgi:hypothetical protein
MPTLVGYGNARRPFAAGGSVDVERRTCDLHPVGGRSLIRFLRRRQPGHLATLKEERFERTSGLDGQEQRPRVFADVRPDVQDHAGREQRITGAQRELLVANLKGEFALHPLLKEAGLPDVCFHDLRHTCATLLLSQGTHPKPVQELLGHATKAMTLGTYSHFLPSMGDQTVRAMEAALS